MSCKIRRKKKILPVDESRVINKIEDPIDNSTIIDALYDSNIKGLCKLIIE